MTRKRHSRFRTRSRREKQEISVLPRLHGVRKAGVADSAVTPVAGTGAVRTPIAGAVVAGVVLMVLVVAMDSTGSVVAVSAVSTEEVVAKAQPLTL